PSAPAEWGSRLGKVDGLARTLVDVAATLGAERGDQAAAELVAWSQAVAASVRSHARDLDTLLPWTLRLAAAAVEADAPATMPAPVAVEECAALVRRLVGL